MPYVPALDGLRALSIIAVVLFHLHGALFKGGWMGVDVFFVLSGYLITRILDAERQKTGRTDFGRFYFNRVVRLMPALLVVLVAVACLTPVFPESALENLWIIAMSALYVSNWNLAFDIGSAGALGHTWSLSVEEQFYLLWPLVFASTPRKLLPALVTVLVAASAAWHLYLNGSGALWYRTQFGSDTHGIGILVGCLLALLHKTDRPGFLARHGVIPAVALLICLFSFNFYRMNEQTLGTFITALAAGWLILALTGRSWLSDALSVRPLVYIGRISYGIYLWHGILWAVARALFTPVNLWERLLYDCWVGLGAFALAALSFKWIEKPIARYKKGSSSEPPRSLMPVPARKVAVRAHR